MKMAYVLAIGLLNACAPSTLANNPSFTHSPVAAINVNGTSLAYTEAGSGPPIVLIHGSVADYRGWSNQVGVLAPDFRVIAYSRRYHPPNPIPDSGLDARVDRQVEDLVALMNTLKLDAAHLIGQSYGGTIAAVFALRHPERIRSLVLVEPGLGTILAGMPGASGPAAEGRELRSVMAGAFASGDPERIVRTYASRVAPGTFDRLEPIVKATLMENARSFELDYTAPRYQLTCADLGEIKVPVLVLKGDRSPPGLQRIAKATASCIPGSQLTTIPNATHWMQLENPRLFSEAVRNFLVEAPAPGR